MRRINCSDALKKLVKEFNDALFIKTRRSDFVHPKSLLKTLRQGKKRRERYGLPANDISHYVKKIEDEYERILNADSGEIKLLITEFESIIAADEMTTAFHEAVTAAMRYDDLREQEFPTVLRRLNIKTCVYCHSQSTLVIKKENARKFRALLQLDHKYPKSRYPFLCTSFFNLYPICANCNLSKSDKPTGFEFYVDHAELDLLKFGLEKKSIVKYWKSGNVDELEIELRAVNGNEKLLAEYGRMFNIRQIYDQQKDIAEELIHKAQVYNGSYKDTLVDSFEKLFPDQAIINRLLIGNYDKSSEMLKRPMAKFVQEIARDLKLIPNEGESGV